jgi:hypothetical protein
MIVIRIQVIGRHGDTHEVLHEQTLPGRESLMMGGYRFGSPIIDFEEGIILDGYTLTPVISDLPEEMRPLVDPQVDMVHG